MAAATPPALLYNLFPLLAGPFTRWRAHVARAAALPSPFSYELEPGQGLVLVTSDGGADAPR